MGKTRIMGDMEVYWKVLDCERSWNKPHPVQIFPHAFPFCLTNLRFYECVEYQNTIVAWSLYCTAGPLNYHSTIILGKWNLLMCNFIHKTGKILWVLLNYWTQTHRWVEFLTFGLKIGPLRNNNSKIYDASNIRKYIYHIWRARIVQSV
jgi:hypothetical protein